MPSHICISNHAIHVFSFSNFLSFLQERVKEKEKDMQKLFSGKEKTLQEKQVSVAKKLGEAEHKAATLQAGKDVFTMMINAPI